MDKREKKACLLEHPWKIRRSSAGRLLERRKMEKSDIKDISVKLNVSYLDEALEKANRLVEALCEAERIANSLFVVQKLET